MIMMLFKILKIKRVQNNNYYHDNCEKKINDNNHQIQGLGFTVLELIIVLALTSFVAITISSGIGNFQTSSHMHDATTTVTQMMRIARERSMAHVDNTAHGVYFYENISGNDAVTLFEGTSYAGRAPAYDRVYDLGTNITIRTITMAGNEIIFSRGLGYPMSGVGERVELEDMTTGVVKTININTSGVIY
jgi:Tfp pilus assembly protein PilE